MDESLNLSSTSTVVMNSQSLADRLVQPPFGEGHSHDRRVLPRCSPESTTTSSSINDVFLDRPAYGSDRFMRRSPCCVRNGESAPSERWRHHAPITQRRTFVKYEVYIIAWVKYRSKVTNLGMSEQNVRNRVRLEKYHPALKEREVREKC
ncbi:hypothetical protein ABEB36_000399 [Hypothenemus hampei]|uniref:Uncharacterized protein n=1 Tax=Hypothenemus hampei TaxID=57062 RepID=A0ABD1FB65_HYPHA